MPPIAVESQYTAIVSKKHNVIFCYVDVPVLPSALVVKGGVNDLTTGIFPYEEMAVTTIKSSRYSFFMG